MTALSDQFRAYYTTPSRESFLSLVRAIALAPESTLIQINDLVGRLYEGRRPADGIHRLWADQFFTQRLFNPYRRNLIRLEWDFDPDRGLAPDPWSLQADDLTHVRTVRADWTTQSKSLIGLLDEMGVAVAATCDGSVAEALIDDPAIRLRVQSGLLGVTVTGGDDVPLCRSALWVPETGLNYFTCKYGRRHLYPTFHLDGSGNCLNLLSPTDTRHNRDLVSFAAGETKCECGRTDIGLSVVRDVAGRLWAGGQMVLDLPPLVGKYKAISLVRAGGSVRCHFVRWDHAPELPEADAAALAGLVGQPVEQIANSVLKNQTPYHLVNSASPESVVWPARG